MPTEPIPSIRSTGQAVDVIHAMIELTEPAIVIIPLTAQGDGGTLIVIDGAPTDRGLPDAIGVVAAAAARSHPRLLAASVRPGGGVADSDAELWFEAADAAAACGCELIEWLVMTAAESWSVPDLLAVRRASAWPDIAEPARSRRRRHRPRPPAMW